MSNKTNEELLYSSWMLEQHEHSKTIVAKDRAERQLEYVKSRIEDYLDCEFEDVVGAIDTLIDGFW